MTTPLHLRPPRLYVEIRGIRVDQARLMRKVVKGPEENSCWAWQGAQHPAGGLFGIKKQQKDGTWHPQMTQTRRLTFMLANPDIDIKGRAVRMACCDSQCVNPNHAQLEPNRQQNLPVQDSPLPHTYTPTPSRKNRKIPFRIEEKKPWPAPVLKFLTL